MVKYFKNNKGPFYTLVAVLCVANLILGFELIKKITYKGIVPAFSYAQVKEKNEVGSKNKNNFFLEIMSSSNSYMKTVLNDKYKSEGITSEVENVFSQTKSVLNPKIYLKSQLPAIFTLVENTDSRTVSSIYDSGDKEKSVAIIENHTEDYGDKEVESTKDLIKSEKPQTIKLDDKNPYIMIYHTHATESYAPIKQNNYHVENRDQNIISVGEVMGSVLSAKGHKLKHLEKYHDLPSFNKSYTQSLKTAKEELAKNESLKIILDVHRDGVDESSKYLAKAKAAARVDINGKSTATFSLVVGPDNPNKEQLLKFARYIRDKSNQKYPGLCKGIIVKPYGKFNQYVSDHYTLLEIGSNLNTLDEAKESGKLVAEILDEVIVDLKEDK